jgi:hypothetical protein
MWVRLELPNRLQDHEAKLLVALIRSLVPEER